jgi:hypothetical protein
MGTRLQITTGKLVHLALKHGRHSQCRSVGQPGKSVQQAMMYRWQARVLNSSGPARLAVQLAAQQ